MAHSTLCTVDGGVRWFFRFFFFGVGASLGPAGCSAASLTCSQSIHHLLLLWQNTLRKQFKEEWFTWVCDFRGFIPWPFGSVASDPVHSGTEVLGVWGVIGRAKQLASRWAGGREKDTQEEGRRKYPSMTCPPPQWHTSPNQAQVLFSTPAKMPFYWDTIKGSIHWLGQTLRVQPLLKSLYADGQGPILHDPTRIDHVQVRCL